jgi:branched-chain amino acid transport system permease protein
MTLLIQQIADGAASGVIYASLALALVLIYRSMSLINIAQGEMAMFSTYLAWQLTAWGVPIVLAAAVVVVISFVAGMAVERLVIRPVQNRSVLDALVVTLGLLLIFNSGAAAIWGTTTKRVPSLFPGRTVALGGMTFGIETLGIVAVLVLVCAGLALLLRHTPIGLAMRATTSRRESARLCGIPANRMLMLGWGLAAGLGALAGVLIAPTLFLDTNMMLGVLIYAFAAAALGGFDSPVGAVIGGVICGITENLAGAYLPFVGSDLKVLVPLVLTVGVLLVRPRGLLGSQRVARV